jgi:hypothetical protein
MSYAQQRLWLLDRLVPTGSVCNNEQTLRLSASSTQRRCEPR